MNIVEIYNKNMFKIKSDMFLDFIESKIYKEIGVPSKYFDFDTDSNITVAQINDLKNNLSMPLTSNRNNTTYPFESFAKYFAK